MRRCPTRTHPCLAAFALLACAAAARAGDGRYQDYPIGSRAMGFGGAWAALADDPSGLTYNPAGICDVRHRSLSVSASLYGLEFKSAGSLQIDASTFSLATLASLNIIPGEAGTVKGYGAVDDRGASWALGFDVTVPSFAQSTTQRFDPSWVSQKTLDRDFDVAVGGAFRATPTLNLGAALHYTLRAFAQTEDALIVAPAQTGGVAAASFHSDASFQAGSLVGVLGAKWILDDGWSLGAAFGLPGLRVHSAGRVVVQDVVFDPDAPDPVKSAAYQVDTEEVDSENSVPALLRIGVAKVVPKRFTVSAQVTAHAGITYERFRVSDLIRDRLRLQSRVVRDPVVDLNLGAEWLARPELSLALGFFTSHSGAQPLQARADGVLLPGSSRLPNISLYGGTFTLADIGEHSVGRFGVSVAYGRGEEAAANDPRGAFAVAFYNRTEVRQLLVYAFLASNFRY